jgi:hypothetical protein
MLGVSVKVESITRWKTISKLWRCYNEYITRTQTHECNLDHLFANHSKGEDIFPLTTEEIAEAHKTDDKLKHCSRRNAVTDKRLEVSLIEDTCVVCKDGWMLIPSPLQRRAVLLYHHYPITNPQMFNLKLNYYSVVC